VKEKLKKFENVKVRFDTTKHLLINTSILHRFL